MPAEPDEVPETPEAAEKEAAPAPKKRPSRTRRAPKDAEESSSKESPAPEAATEGKDEDEGPRAPKRAKLDDGAGRLLRLRRTLDRRRPVFGRQAANRYYRIGRDGAWRRPRGLQSKQRRHYGYRPRIVRVGYRSPARVRGRVPSGFLPILVRTTAELARLDAATEAAVIARTVGTRRRLVLEEEAQKLGIRVLNPILKSETEA
jgi:large subunit ribosomal protein L32e